MACQGRVLKARSAERKLGGRAEPPPHKVSGEGVGASWNTSRQKCQWLP